MWNYHQAPNNPQGPGTLSSWYRHDFSAWIPPSHSRAPSKAQQSRLALEERFCDIEIRIEPAPWQRGLIAPYGEQPSTLPTIRAFAHPDTQGWANVLPAVRRFVDHCRSVRDSRTEAFTHTRSMWKITQLGKDMIPVLGSIESLARHPRSDRHFDPYVQLAVEAFLAAGLAQSISLMFGSISNVNAWLSPSYADPTAANLCNAFVAKLRDGASHNRAGRMEEIHKGRQDKCARQVRTYLSAVDKHHPSSHIERLELSVPGLPLMSAHEEYKLIQERSAKLLYDLKTRYGDAIVADIRKIDHGPSGRYLVHILLALDGPNSSELKEFHRTVLDIWDAMFPGIAAMVNCNQFDQFMYRGCGALIRQHESLSNQMDKATIYLAETDRMIRIGRGEDHDGLLIGTVSGCQTLEPIKR